MSRAITTHELSTRTSMPAILPTRQDVPNIAVSSSQLFATHWSWALGVLLDEGPGGVGDFPPAVVDGQGVPAAGDFDDLGDAGVALLPLVGGVGDGPRDGVVHLAVDDEQRHAVGGLGVNFRLGPRVEVGGGRLEQRATRARHGEAGVQLMRLVLGDAVGEGKPELDTGERNGAAAVGGVADHGGG